MVNIICIMLSDTYYHICKKNTSIYRNRQKPYFDVNRAILEIYEEKIDLYGVTYSYKYVTLNIYFWLFKDFTYLYSYKL